MIDNLNIWLQGCVVFIAQLLFVYARTLNVAANAVASRKGVFITGVFVYFTWLLSVSLGVNSLIKGDWLVVGFGLFGGLLGADLAITGFFKKLANGYFAKSK
jgi:hypothetical protein